MRWGGAADNWEPLDPSFADRHPEHNRNASKPLPRPSGPPQAGTVAHQIRAYGDPMAQQPDQTPAHSPDLPPHLAAALDGYREGAFLMAAQTPGRGRHSPPPCWYQTDPRGVIRLDPPGFHISRRLRQTMRSGRFEVTTDAAFARVIRACADRRRDGAWIDRHIVTLFEAFHDAGLAHSVEAWRAWPEETSPIPAPEDAVYFDHANRRTLVGGLYGLRVGGVFCGEAMFSRPDLGGRDASKVCLARTILHCRARGFTLLDTQMWSEHLATFGCEEMAAAEYQKLLEQHRDDVCEWGALTSMPSSS